MGCGSSAQPIEDQPTEDRPTEDQPTEDPTAQQAPEVQPNKERSAPGQILGVLLVYLVDDSEDGFVHQALSAAQAFAPPDKAIKDKFWPKDGIKLRDPDEFNPDDPNFYEVKEMLTCSERACGYGQICPRDGKPNCSLVDALDKQGKAGEVNLFQSWVWSYKVKTMSQVWKALANTHSTCGRGATCIWICFFCNNQFRLLTGEAQSMEELGEVFQQNLTAANRMITVLDKWRNPIYNQRAWCMFEQYCCHNLGITPVMILPPEQEQELIEMFEAKRGAEVASEFATTDLQKAKASYKADEEGIKSIVEQGEGFTALNRVVKTSLVECVTAIFGRRLLTQTLNQKPIAEPAEEPVASEGQRVVAKYRTDSRIYKPAVVVKDQGPEGLQLAFEGHSDLVLVPNARIMSKCSCGLLFKRVKLLEAHSKECKAGKVKQATRTGYNNKREHQKKQSPTNSRKYAIQKSTLNGTRRKTAFTKSASSKNAISNFSGARKMCWDFTQGKCTYGERCKFNHDFYSSCEFYSKVQTLLSQKESIMGAQFKKQYHEQFGKEIRLPLIRN